MRRPPPPAGLDGRRRQGFTLRIHPGGTNDWITGACCEQRSDPGRRRPPPPPPGGAAGGGGEGGGGGGVGGGAGGGGGGGGGGAAAPPRIDYGFIARRTASSRGGTVA